MPEKNAETCFVKMERICLRPTAGKTVPMSPSVAGEYERRKICRNRPIRPVMRMMTGDFVLVVQAALKTCLLGEEFKHIGGRLCMKGFPKRWIIILRTIYPRRNFPHAHFVGRVGNQ
jgi:hypothetical protein